MSAVVQVSAVIFDLDGVLVDSSVVVDKTWMHWAAERGLDWAIVARTIPGMRTRDAVALLAPALDADSEAAAIVARETSLAHCVKPIRGAAELIGQLPAGRWGIATSGTEDIARPRLAHAGLPIPDVLITAEMVGRGKPAPDVYLRAAAGLGADPAACLVFEDAPSGVAAATSAGCTVVGVLTWAPRALLATPYAVRDLSGITVDAGPAYLRLCLSTSA